MCCWDTMIKTYLGRAQGRMGKVCLRLQSTWISWDMGALHSVPSKPCTTLAQAHGNTKVCVIPFSQKSKFSHGERSDCQS